MQETDLIVNRCKEVLEKFRNNESIDKSNLKLELQTMATIINARKTDLMIEVYNDRLIHKQAIMIKEEN